MEPADTARKADQIAVTAYVCDDGRGVSALYPDSQTVVLTFEGNVYRLGAAVSGSGARYAGKGLQWWAKGDEAMLTPLAPGEEIASNPGVRCLSSAHTRSVY